MDQQAAKRRWVADSGRLAAEVMRRLGRNGKLKDLGLGEVDGRVDLRGFANVPRAAKPMASGGERGRAGPALISLPVVRRLRLVGLDFSGSRLSDWMFRNVEIIDCRFDDAHLDWHVFGGLVADTSFRGTDLRGSLLGKKTIYRNCVFERADLRKATATAITFENVAFEDANLRDVEFPDSRFIGCRFAGKLDGTMFGGEGPPDALDGTDFGGAELVLVRFRALDLRGVIPPRHPDNVVVRNPRCVIDRLTAEVAADPAHPLAWATHLLDEWSRQGPNQEILITHRADLTVRGKPEDAQPAVDALRRLELACAGGNKPARLG